MFGIMNSVIRVATQVRGVEESEYEKEMRIRTFEARRREAARDQLEVYRWRRGG